MTVYKVDRNDVVNAMLDIFKRNGIMLSRLSNPSLTAKEEQSFPTLEDLAKDTYMPLKMLEEVEVLLNEKKQLIFYGPPGTSKTFVARKFSEYFAHGLENVEIVQFHQSYSYEDFVEGIKPILSESGQSNGFARQPGLFKKFVKKCMDNPDRNFVLIIDEINRGNISKIFGELIYLLEYRNEKISLTYSPEEPFKIPNNLFIIGTMNSADRSIAFVDYAMRRRFYFINFYPDPRGDILYSWFAKNNIKIDPSLIVNLLNKINEKITSQLGKEYQIGHSYFMVKELDRSKLERIIDYAIIPLFEQYFFGRKQKVSDMSQICSDELNPMPASDQPTTDI